MKWKIRRGDGERYTRFIAAFCAALMVLTAGLLTVFSSMVRAEDYMVIVEWDSSTSSAVYYADDGNNTPCYVVSVDGWDVISAVSGEETSVERKERKLFTKWYRAGSRIL